MANVFANYIDKAWPTKYSGRLQFIQEVRGGIPSDANKAEGWLKSKIVNPDVAIQQLVAQTMVERNIEANEALKIVNDLKNLCGFKRDEVGLYIEGRQLKAALKEACVVALSTEKIVNKGWGTTRKSLRPFLAEHVQVVEDRLHLQKDDGYVQEPDGVDQRFTHTFNGNGIAYEEYVVKPYVDFTVVTDAVFSEQDWAMLWLTGGYQGLGATRSMGFGRYEISRWEKVSS